MAFAAVFGAVVLLAGCDGATGPTSAGGEGGSSAGAGSADKVPIVRLPTRPGVTYHFAPLLGPVASPNRFSVKIVKHRFPAAVTVSWVGGLLPTQGDASGTRTLTSLQTGKRFEPIFQDQEKNKVSATAPWVSRAVWTALAAGEDVEGFEEGGLSLSGQAQGVGKGGTLRSVKGRTYLTVLLDGRAVRVRAIGANESTYLIADDPANPLVLEYRTIGVGWRLDEVTTH